MEPSGDLSHSESTPKFAQYAAAIAGKIFIFTEKKKKINQSIKIADTCFHLSHGWCISRWYSSWLEFTSGNSIN